MVVNIAALLLRQCLSQHTLSVHIFAILSSNNFFVTGFHTIAHFCNDLIGLLWALRNDGVFRIAEWWYEFWHPSWDVGAVGLHWTLT